VDKIYEAYQETITEKKYARDSGEGDVLRRLVKALQAYQKKPGHSTLSKLEDTLDNAGKPELGFNFDDRTQKFLEYLGDRFFGTPRTYNPTWDDDLWSVLTYLKKIV
jgi:hypothetical protein